MARHAGKSPISLRKLKELLGVSIPSSSNKDGESAHAALNREPERKWWQGGCLAPQVVDSTALDAVPMLGASDTPAAVPTVASVEECATPVASHTTAPADAGEKASTPFSCTAHQDSVQAVASTPAPEQPPALGSPRPPATNESVHVELRVRSSAPVTVTRRPQAPLPCKAAPLQVRTSAPARSLRSAPASPRQLSTHDSFRRAAAVFMARPYESPTTGTPTASVGPTPTHCQPQTSVTTPSTPTTGPTSPTSSADTSARSTPRSTLSFGRRLSDVLKGAADALQAYNAHIATEHKKAKKRRARAAQQAAQLAAQPPMIDLGNGVCVPVVAGREPERSSVPVRAQRRMTSLMSSRKLPEPVPVYIGGQF